MDAKRTANRVIRLLNEFKKLDPKISLDEVYLFLEIARTPDQRLAQLEKSTGLNQPKLSRAASHLGQYEKLNQQGLGLVDFRADPENLSAKLFRLTRKGDLVLDSISHILKEE